jgi:LPXTG-motif cell wall-anchored protein
MFRKSMAAAAVAALMILGGAGTAFAADDDVSGYTPVTPSTLSLAGSTASGVCENGAPYISFDVVMTDPAGAATSHEVYLVLTDGTHTDRIHLGTLDADNSLAGRILWPGASVENGVATGWPGWATINGALVETNGNFAWTRGDITATLEVNPELTVALSYPPATAACAVPPAAPAASDGDQAGILPVTGLNVPVVPIAIGGGIVLLGGAGLLLARRRRHS